MAIRNNPYLHDRVIEIAADNLKQTGNFRVYINPGNQHNTSIGNLYPDLIVTPTTSNNVQFIIEVETVDTVTANEAMAQWKGYSNLGATFYLLIPRESRTLAENICRQYGIRAKFGTYFSNQFNQLTINYE